MSDDPAPTRLGVFGGTFDPPHIGHLVAAQEALEHLTLDRVLFVPARVSPHRTDELASPAETRVGMVRAAIAGDERFVLDELEVEREGPSYTVDTLQELVNRGPDAELVLLMGADQWTRFADWHRPRDVARLARLALLTREGERPSGIEPGFAGAPPPPFLEVPMTRLDISATMIRRRVQEGRPIRYLVPDAVRRIIEVENLYLSTTRSTPD